jgi:brefeldin A-inhibited guanine nucleotide-exchange protein
VKKKMTKDDFIRMNRGINNDGDLPPAYLSELYDDIHGREIKMTEDISEVRKPRNKDRTKAGGPPLARAPRIAR